MAETVMTVRVTDQRLTLVNVPLIASGGVSEVRIDFQFCELWDGCGKAAVFYRDPSAVYQVPLYDGWVLVPHEVLAAEGFVYFGVMGVGDSDDIRTSEVVRLYVAQGAPTTATANHKDPTPDIYQQLMAAHGLTEARFTELVALRKEGGVGLFDGEDEHIRCNISTNGTGAQIWLEISGLELPAYGSHYTEYFIPDTYTPLADVELTSPDPAIRITLLEHNPDYGDYSQILIENIGPGDFGPDMEVTASAFYPLRWPYSSEVSDIRVGYNGKTYPTAGDSVRGQVNSIIETLCPPFSVKDSAVRCEPVTGYPINIRSHFGVTTVDGTPIPWDDFTTELTICGKNLYDRVAYPLVEGKYITTNGKPTGYNATTNYACTEKFIPIDHRLRGKQITLNHPPVETGGGNPRMAFYTAANENTMISGAGGNGYTHTVPDTAAYMRFSVPKKYADGTQIQIELGTMVTSFEAYRAPEVFQARLPAVSDFYQGYFDWSTGGLYSTHDLTGGTLVEKASPTQVSVTSARIIRPTGSPVLYSDTGETEVSGRVNPAEMLDILTRKFDALAATTAAVPVGGGAL